MNSRNRTELSWLIVITLVAGVIGLGYTMVLYSDYPGSSPPRGFFTGMLIGGSVTAFELFYSGRPIGRWLVHRPFPQYLLLKTVIMLAIIYLSMWFEYRYANGYVGAFMDDGFACPLLYQISEELRLSLPEIFQHHTLRKLWAFKYDSRLSGIPIHADFAAVNVNFWITPDEANLDSETGGLQVWDKEAPADWDFAKYNANESAMRGFLKESGARAVNVPHRQNRALIFNSDLFHETGDLNFRDGYENRRINITMLYGKRDDV